ncbi:hypothetical protein Catovirus_1_288 [Catovirus CTV1]|uniref:Uncharacterized protein n=1 Tax=Catovirus CTV1 TaxID=1977631 RepID=A0A1V0S9B3_9VIRU|nr:hypothetical protein Catovirus_1_288 [Catovirus CTV1]
MKLVAIFLLFLTLNILTFVCFYNECSRGELFFCQAVNIHNHLKYGQKHNYYANLLGNTTLYTSNPYIYITNIDIIPKMTYKPVNYSINNYPFYSPYFRANERDSIYEKYNVTLEQEISFEIKFIVQFNDNTKFERDIHGANFYVPKGIQVNDTYYDDYYHVDQILKYLAVKENTIKFI